MRPALCRSSGILKLEGNIVKFLRRNSFAARAMLLFGAFAISSIQVFGTPTLGAADKKVAQQVEAILRARVSSPNKSLKMVVKPTSKSRDGYFSEVIVEGKPVQIKKLSVSEFSLRAKDVRISLAGLKEQKIRTLQSNTRFHAVVTEDDLTQMFARGKHTRAMALKVKYLKDPNYGDVIQVSGNWKWTWFSGPVIGVGKLRVTKENQVYADILSLKLNGSEVPTFVRNKFSSSLNPVLDYDDVPFQPRFRTLTVQGKKAILEG